MTLKLDMVSKMDRSELEDKFIRMYEENIIIKRYAKKQDEKIKKLVEFRVYLVLICVYLECERDVSLVERGMVSARSTISTQYNSADLQFCTRHLHLWQNAVF